MDDLKILVWAINESQQLMEEASTTLRHTAALYDIDFDLFGVGRVFNGHKERIWILEEYLAKIDPDTIVVCMDGSDTLFNGSKWDLIGRFKEKNTGVLISGEKEFSWQSEMFRDKFDQISQPYKYVNAGTFMGYAGCLHEMLGEIFEIDNIHSWANDQGLLGIWAYQNIHRPEKVQLDTNAEIFWVTTRDWAQLKEESAREYSIFNPTTGKSPMIIHVVGLNEKVHKQAYNLAYANIIQNHARSRFRIFALFPITDQDYLEYESEGQDGSIVAGTQSQDCHDHPYITVFSYGSAKINSETHLRTDYFHQAISILEAVYYIDYLVHYPSGFLLDADTLYEQVRDTYSAKSIESSPGYDTPRWQSFIYHRGKYYPADLPLTSIDKRSPNNNYSHEQKSVLKEYRPLYQYLQKNPAFDFEIISLGGWYGPAAAMNNMKMRETAYPFCMIYSTCDFLLEMIDIPDKTSLVKTNVSHRRLIARLRNPQPILFVRTIVSNDYEASFEKLLRFMALIKEQYGRDDRLVIVMHDQGVGTTKVRRLSHNIMVWAVEGTKESFVRRGSDIFCGYQKIIEYCMDEQKWNYDESLMKFHPIVNHSSKELFMSGSDTPMTKVFQRIHHITLPEWKCIDYAGQYVRIENNQLREFRSSGYDNGKEISLSYLICNLLQRNGIADCEMIFDMNDEPTIDYGFPVFANAKRKSDPRPIHLFPVKTIGIERLDYLRNIYRKGQSRPWNTRDDHVFFGGPANHRIRQMMSYSTFEVELEADQTQVQEAYFQNKFVLSMEGEGPDPQLPYLFLAGCCVILLEPIRDGWLTDFLEYFCAGEDYLLVEYRTLEGVRSIETKLKRAFEQNDCEKIAQRGALKALEVFSPESVRKRFSQSISNYCRVIEEGGISIDKDKFQPVMNASEFATGFLADSTHLDSSPMLELFHKIDKIRHPKWSKVPFRAMYFRIVNNLIVSKHEAYCWNSRHRILIDLLQEMFKKYEVPDCEFIFNSDSECYVDYDFPVFCYTKRRTDPRRLYFMPIETLHFRSQDRLQNIKNQSALHGWHSRKRSIYFAGQMSNPIREIMSRSKFDIFLTEKKRQPFSQAFEYQYVLNLDGNGAAFRIPDLFMTGSCVIFLEKENDGFELAFSKDFIAGIHYILVEYEFEDTVSDIDIKLQKAIDVHDGEAIASKGMAKALEVFSRENVLRDLANEINSYANTMNKCQYDYTISNEGEPLSESVHSCKHWRDHKV